MLSVVFFSIFSSSFTSFLPFTAYFSALHKFWIRVDATSVSIHVQPLHLCWWMASTTIDWIRVNFDWWFEDSKLTERCFIDKMMWMTRIIYIVVQYCCCHVYVNGVKFTPEMTTMMIIIIIVMLTTSTTLPLKQQISIILETLSVSRYIVLRRPVVFWWNENQIVGWLSAKKTADQRLKTTKTTISLRWGSIVTCCRITSPHHYISLCHTGLRSKLMIAKNEWLNEYYAAAGSQEWENNGSHKITRVVGNTIKATDLGWHSAQPQLQIAIKTNDLKSMARTATRS